tara:strand:- start:561 stop:908 length:348 start_codon:yes stop_codon:yes gene_type:complete
MTVKLLLLKSGEDVVADVSEMVVGEEENRRVVGYFLSKPCIVKMQQPEVLSEQRNETKSGYRVSLFPWMPLSKESTIPIAADWVITMVEPVTKLNEMYMEDVVNNEQTNKASSVD